MKSLGLGLEKVFFGPKLLVYSGAVHIYI